MYNIFNQKKKGVTSHNYTSSYNSYDKTYVYDDFGQLIRENNKALDKTFVYCYDNIGNISKVLTYAYTIGALGDASNEVKYDYDQYRSDRLTDFNEKSITYNALGCPTSYDGRNYSWNRGRLTAITKGSTSQAGTLYENCSFTYDAYGRRRNKTYVYDSNPASTSDYSYRYDTTYTYDNSGRLIRETLVEATTYTGGSSSTREFVYLYDESGIIGVMYGTSLDNLQTYYFHRNLQGDVTAVYDSNGSKVGEYAYDAWGNCTILSGVANDLVKNNPIRYRGYYFDRETGLYYLNARYYNPEWRRFISPDSTDYLDPETPNGLNLYAYCNNDPVNYADPSGHLAFFIVTAIIGAALGLGITAAVDYIPDQEFNLHWGWYVGAGLLGAAIGAGVGMAVSYYATGSIASSTGKVMSGLFGKTSFYRTMSADDYASLKSTGKMPHTKETFISPDAAYASKYNGVTVKFTVRNRTVNWLTKIGVRDTSALVSSTYPSMSVVSKGWTVANAFFKAECGIINIGLGAGTAWEIFNKGILSFGLI